MFMKNKNRFSSYGEALKRLELIKGQEELQEATKYVLKQNSPKAEAPVSEPSMDLPPAPPVDSEPTDSMSAEPSTDDAVDSAIAPDATSDDSGLGLDGQEGSEEGKRSDYMAEVQKYAGKLGQELRDLHDRMESDDIKYILNMIISAVDLDKLSDEDIEDIAKKFEREEEEGGMGSEEPTGEEPAPSAEPELDMNEYDSMSALDEFVNTPMDTDEVNLSKYSIKEEGEMDAEDETKELDLDEIKAAIGDTLSKYFK
jgi:hypothetical protein